MAQVKNKTSFEPDGRSNILSRRALKVGLEDLEEFAEDVDEDITYSITAVKPDNRLHFIFVHVDSEDYPLPEFAQTGIRDPNVDFQFTRKV